MEKYAQALSYAIPGFVVLIIIEEMAARVREGTDTSVERHVIARRASETEAILLLHLLEGAA